MTPLEAIRCVKMAAAFLRSCDGSPEETLGLEEAVLVLIRGAAEGWITEEDDL